MDNLLEWYCFVDDFFKDFLPEFEKNQIESGQKKSRKACSMSISEIMTIMIYFHQMRFRDFKCFYTQYVKQHLNKEFPKLLSYNRFVELMPSICFRMCAFIQVQSKTKTGIYFVALVNFKWVSKQNSAY